jgi:hypothetical protein
MGGFDAFETLEPRSSRVPTRLIGSALYLDWAATIPLRSDQTVEICSSLRLLLIVWTMIWRSRSSTVLVPTINAFFPDLEGFNRFKGFDL